MSWLQNHLDLEFWHFSLVLDHGQVTLSRCPLPYSDGGDLAQRVGLFKGRWEGNPEAGTAAGGSPVWDRGTAGGGISEADQGTEKYSGKASRSPRWCGGIPAPQGQEDGHTRSAQCWMDGIDQREESSPLKILGNYPSSLPRLCYHCWHAIAKVLGWQGRGRKISRFPSLSITLR